MAEEVLNLQYLSHKSVVFMGFSFNLEIKYITYIK